MTGAAGGLGREISARLLADELQVIGLDIDAAGLESMASTGFSSHVVDLTDPNAINAVFADIAESQGGIDALVNNAGTCFMSDFPNIPAQELDRQMALNFSGAFHCCQAAIKLMEGRPGVPEIVNIRSNGAYNFDVFDRRIIAPPRRRLTR